MQRPLKILHVVAGAAHGGAETFCLDAIKSLHAQGIGQYVVCRPHENFKEALEKRRIRYDTITFSRFKKRREQDRISKIIDDYNPDAIHCWMGRASSFMPSKVSAPVLGWFGGYYNLKRYKRCDFYMGVTKDIVRHIIEKTGKPHRTFLAHTFGTLDPGPLLQKSDFNIPDNEKIVLLLSRMHRKKGIDTLLKAATRLDDVWFFLAGSGPDLLKYQALARKLNVHERVRFLGWRQDRASLLGLADVCVLPSRYEPFGTVIAEAWYAKVPLVATRAAGASQYVAHQTNGLLCDIDDWQELAEQIKTALTDEKVRSRLIEGGSEAYSAIFSRDVVTRSLIRAYEHMVQAGKCSAGFIDFDDVDSSPRLFPNEKDEIVRKVALVYGSIHADDTLGEDAAFIQKKGLYNFYRRNLFSKSIEILSEPEINIILQNSKNEMWIHAKDR